MPSCLRGGFSAQPMSTNTHDVTAVILAGGLGTRLRAAVPDVPKVLAPVNGRPFLSYLLDRLLAAGVREAVLCTGFKANQVEATFGPRYHSLRLAYSVETQPLGTGGALRNALPLVKSPVALVMNGDSFVDVNLVELVRWFGEGSADVGIVLKWMDDCTRYGRVAIGPDGAVSSFEEKRPGAGAGWINAGVYLLRLPPAPALPEGTPMSLEHDWLPALAAAGALSGYTCEGAFIDIGTPKSHAQAEGFFHEARQAPCR